MEFKFNPDQKWTYISPGENGGVVYTTMTEQEIIDRFFPYWSEQMERVGKADLISKEACIEDWIVVHWAAKGGREEFKP